MARPFDAFGYWIESARQELEARLRFTSAWVRREMAGAALWRLTRALQEANRMQCRERKALCLRLMNWVRVEMRIA